MPSFNVQNAKALTITEGDVKTIHDTNGQLLWGAVGYSTKYEGDTFQNGDPTPNNPIAIQVVTGEQTVTVSDGGSNSQSYEVNLGKNLWGGFASSVPREGLDISFVNNADGTISVTSGTTSAQHVSLLTSLAVSNNHYITLKAGSYVVSGGTANIGLQVLDTSGALLGTSNFTLTTEKQVYVRAVIESGVTVTATTIKPQLELGSTPTTYAPYFTPIELCKIGTYQDYIWKDGSDWKVHKAIGKIVLDGTTEEWITSGSVYFTRVLTDLVAETPQTAQSLGFSDYFLVVGYNYRTPTTLFYHPNKNLQIQNTNYPTLSAWTDWLGLHKPTVYYQLATPTDTIITDTTLIGQLNAIEDWLTRYGYTATVSGTLPLIINQTTLS